MFGGDGSPTKDTYDVKALIEIDKTLDMSSIHKNIRKVTDLAGAAGLAVPGSDKQGRRKYSMSSCNSNDKKKVYIVARKTQIDSFGFDINEKPETDKVTQCK